MKNVPLHTRKSDKGFTLIEISVVIAVLIALMSTGVFFSSAVTNWNAGRIASESLRSVYVAQRTYLADNPTASLSSLTEAKLLPYLPNKASSFPEIKSLEGSTLQINFNVSPPVVKDSSGQTYDPSESSTDSLWDVGE